jgi:hypothetical protein
MLVGGVLGASRPRRGSALDGKVAAIMGASLGMTGTAHAEAEVLQGVTVS